MGVGSLLQEHSSGLSSAIKSLLQDAFEADNHAKDLALDRKIRAYSLPSFK